MQMETTYIAAVVITGLVVVFLALIILVIILSISNSVASKKSNENTSTKSSPQAINAAPKETPVVTEKIEQAQVDNDEETVAVISAVIAALSQQNGKLYSVKSIKPTKKNVSSGKPAWGLAGLRENTRPF